MIPWEVPVGGANFVRAHPRFGAEVAKLKDAGAGVIEREDIWGRHTCRGIPTREPHALRRAGFLLLDGFSKPTWRRWQRDDPHHL